MAALARDADKDPKGLYETLGVGPTADDNEIRKAYRRLALRWHPDKNQNDPSATEQFQRLSSAYEVLSDPQKREMYDNTGCIDEEELMEGAGADLAEELFSRIFSMHEDLDEEEQAMMDEFLRLAGASAFKRGRGGSRRRGRKGRGGRGASRKGGGASGRAEEAMFEEAFMAMMAGGAGLEAAPVCPQGHNLKRRKAEAADYECDVCSKDIVAGKRFFDCRKCDWSICQRCYKEAEEKLREEDGELLDHDEILEAFCEMNTTVVRQGRGLKHKCDICKKLLASEEEVLPHMEENHLDVIEAFLEESMSAGAAFGGMGGGLGPGGPGMEELLMGMMGAGMMPEMPTGYPGSSGPSRQSGSRRKR